MSVPALATIEGLRARAADVSDAPRAQAAIEDISALIHAATGNRWITTDGELDPATPPVLFTVAYRATKRTLSNPDDITSETLGPWSQTRRPFDGSAFLTKQDEADIAGAGGVTSGLGVVRLEAPWPTHRVGGYFGSEEADEDDEDDEDEEDEDDA